LAKLIDNMRSGFTEDEWVELRVIAMTVGSRGPFDANDFLTEYIDFRTADQGGTTEGYNARPVNAGDVATILGDLCDLGVLRPIGGNPPMWELARSPEN
jgi:hypothetical protein